MPPTVWKQKALATPNTQSQSTGGGFWLTVEDEGVDVYAHMWREVRRLALVVPRTSELTD